jgi:hypothetical protein
MPRYSGVHFIEWPYRNEFPTIKEQTICTAGTDKVEESDGTKGIRERPSGPAVPMVHIRPSHGWISLDLRELWE